MGRCSGCSCSGSLEFIASADKTINGVKKYFIEKHLEIKRIFLEDVVRAKAHTATMSFSIFPRRASGGVFLKHIHNACHSPGYQLSASGIRMQVIPGIEAQVIEIYSAFSKQIADWHTE